MVFLMLACNSSRSTKSKEEAAPAAPSDPVATNGAKPADDDYQSPPVPPELDSTVVFLMTQEALGARIDIDALLHVSQKIFEAVSKLHMSKQLKPVPMSVFLAVKPGGKLKTWAVGIDGPLDPADAALIEASTSSVKAPAVLGAIALAFAYPRKGHDLTGAPPFPQSWKDAAARAGETLSIPEGLLAAVWPD